VEMKYGRRAFLAALIGAPLVPKAGAIYHPSYCKRRFILPFGRGRGCSKTFHIFLDRYMEGYRKYANSGTLLVHDRLKVPDSKLDPQMNLLLHTQEVTGSSPVAPTIPFF